MTDRDIARGTERSDAGGGWFGRSSVRVAVAAVVGVVAAVVTGALGSWDFAPSVGWIAAAGLYLVVTWSIIGPMDAVATAAHARREDPTRRVTSLIVLAASVASLTGVGYLLVQASGDTGATKPLVAGLGVLSVAVSWVVVHTLFTLRYALLYYGAGAGGIDFNQDEPPRYTDLAYLAFTVGMTFQVSDTSLRNHAVRIAVLRQALLSYLFGSVVLAAAVNLIASLAGSGH